MSALAGALLLALVSIPPLSGPVVDTAGALSGPERVALEDLARGAHASTSKGPGPQLAFLIVPTLEGEPIEDFSIRAAEKWQLGSEEADDGLLFVVATEDHQVRIEVGGGLEGRITDVQAGRIIRETMTPAFRKGAIGAGLRAGAERALGLLGVDVQGMSHGRHGHRERSPLRPIALLVGIGLLLFFGRRFGFRMGGWGGGGRWGGGGFGGGGFGGGGGGYGGGGGGFSGGGASGKW